MSFNLPPDVTCLSEPEAASAMKTKTAGAARGPQGSVEEGVCVSPYTWGSTSSIECPPTPDSEDLIEPECQSLKAKGKRKRRATTNRRSKNGYNLKRNMQPQSRIQRSRACSVACASGPFTVVPRERPLSLLDLFSGSGHLTQAARRAGWTSREIDIMHGDDLTLMSLQDELLGLLPSRKAWWVHMRPPCTTFSFVYLASSHSNSRTKGNPEGLGASVDEVLGNALADFSVRMAHACIANHTWFTIEQPRRSWMWRLGSMRHLAMVPEVHITHLTMCSFGCAYQKQTSFMSNGGFTLAIASTCKCKQRHHVLLQGSVRDTNGQLMHRTKLAAAYPPMLCEALVSSASRV